MEEKMLLRLFTLEGEFKTLKTIEVGTICEAREYVERHLADSGYTNLKTIEDDDYSLRYIADPPKGRKGRNVASIDF